jgi:uncharacterized membrane protein YdfJ with MMPL/SSD domain
MRDFHLPRHQERANLHVGRGLLLAHLFNRGRPVLLEVGSEREQEILVERSTRSLQGTAGVSAAAAAAAGFLSFLPTSYRGLAELGSIAGVGMVIAYAVSMTLLPALLSRLDPPPEPRPLGYAALAPVDHFLQRHRIAVVAGTSIVALAGLPFPRPSAIRFQPDESAGSEIRADSHSAPVE